LKHGKNAKQYKLKKKKLSTKSPQPSEPSTICLSLKRGRS
jgi:hypothetical protein